MNNVIVLFVGDNILSVATRFADLVRSEYVSADEWPFCFVLDQDEEIRAFHTSWGTNKEVDSLESLNEVTPWDVGWNRQARLIIVSKYDNAQSISRAQKARKTVENSCAIQRDNISQVLLIESGCFKEWKSNASALSWEILTIIVSDKSWGKSGRSVSWESDILESVPQWLYGAVLAAVKNKEWGDEIFKPNFTSPFASVNAEILELVPEYLYATSWSIQYLKESFANRGDKLDAITVNCENIELALIPEKPRCRSFRWSRLGWSKKVIIEQVEANIKTSSQLLESHVAHWRIALHQYASLLVDSRGECHKKFIKDTKVKAAKLIELGGVEGVNVLVKCLCSSRIQAVEKQNIDWKSENVFGEKALRDLLRKEWGQFRKFAAKYTLLQLLIKTVVSLLFAGLWVLLSYVSSKPYSYLFPLTAIAFPITTIWLFLRKRRKVKALLDLGFNSAKKPIDEYFIEICSTLRLASAKRVLYANQLFLYRYQSKWEEWLLIFRNIGDKQAVESIEQIPKILKSRLDSLLMKRKRQFFETIPISDSVKMSFEKFLYFPIYMNCLEYARTSLLPSESQQNEFVRYVNEDWAKMNMVHAPLVNGQPDVFTIYPFRHKYLEDCYCARAVQPHEGLSNRAVILGIRRSLSIGDFEDD